MGGRIFTGNAMDGRASALDFVLPAWNNPPQRRAIWSNGCCGGVAAPGDR
jgi:hypothetical protein